MGGETLQLRSRAALAERRPVRQAAHTEDLSTMAFPPNASGHTKSQTWEFSVKERWWQRVIDAACDSMDVGGRAGDVDQFNISQGGSDLFCLGEHPQAPTWEVKIQADLNPAGVFAFCQWK